MISESDGSELPIDEREGLVLFFTVGGHTFGTRLTEVVRVDDSGINEAKEALSAYEEMEWVDLRRFFNLGAGEECEKTITIVLEGEEDRFYLLADEVDKIVPAQDAQEVQWPRQLAGEAAEIFSGFFRHGKRLAPAVDVLAVREAAKREGR